MANQPPEHDPRYDWLYESPAGQPGRRPRGRGQRGAAQAGYRPSDDPYDQPTQPVRQQPPGDDVGGTRVLPAEPGAGATPPGHPPRQPPRQPRPASGGRPPTSPPRRSGRRRFPIVRTILLVLLAYVVFLVAVPVLAWNRVDK